MKGASEKALKNINFLYAYLSYKWIHSHIFTWVFGWGRANLCIVRFPGFCSITIRLVAAVHLIPHYLYIFVDLCLAKMSNSSRIYSNCAQKAQQEIQIEKRRESTYCIGFPIGGIPSYEFPKKCISKA